MDSRYLIVDKKILPEILEKPLRLAGYLQKARLQMVQWNLRSMAYKCQGLRTESQRQEDKQEGDHAAST